MNEKYGYFQGGVGTALEQESPAANKLEQLYAQARQEREANEAKAKGLAEGLSLRDDHHLDRERLGLVGYSGREHGKDRC